MPKLARTLVLGVALAAMNLAAMTAVAHAYPLDPTSQRHRALGQVELLATADHAVASQQQNPTDALERFRRGERASQEPTASQEQNPTDAVERFRRGERASHEQPTTDAALRRVLAQEHSYSFRGYSDTPAPAPDEPSGQPNWLVLGLGVLAAALALSTGLAVLAARRAGRKMRAGQAA